MSTHAHKDFTIANPTPSQKQNSIIARYGNQYYPVDTSYDKRVYENTPGNWVKIVLGLLAFWFFQALHWWGVFELGISNSPTLMIYSICIFLAAICFGAGLLTSGKFANFKKRKHEFLITRIAVLEADENDRKTREKQDREYHAKIKAQQQQQEKAKLDTKINSDGQTKTVGADDVVISVPNNVAQSKGDGRLIQQ